MIKLSKRLQAVAELAAPADSIADVGCDHGYIPIYLVEQGSCKKAIAMDINKGPLQRAQEHIVEHQLGAYIETRLSDGLQALKKGEVQAVVIAGMGGATMQGILKAGRDVIEEDTLLVLQPQSELREFRSYLMSHGFSILAEDMVFEDGKYYPMMKVQKFREWTQSGNSGKKSCATGGIAYSEMELRFGPLLLKKRHPVLKEFLLWQEGQKQAILEGLSQPEDTPKGEASRRKSQRIDWIEEELSYIRQALKVYK